MRAGRRRGGPGRAALAAARRPARAGLRQGALALALLALAPEARAWGWLTTPPPAAEPVPESTAEPVATPVPPVRSAPAFAARGGVPDPLQDQGAAGLCLAEILQAERRYGIPDNLLLALGLQEAGYKSGRGLTVWPWTVNAAGDGRRFASAAEAIGFVRARQAEGVAVIDVGCLQVNLRWHPDAFASLSAAFDPYNNVDYAARFLLSLYGETGDWWQAAGRYHSRSSGPQDIYLSALQRNHQVARARLGQFLQLAAGAAPDFAADFPSGLTPAGEGWPAPLALLPSRPPRTPTPYRTEGAIWGADISGEEGARRSLYSALDLEPILPAFLPPET